MKQLFIILSIFLFTQNLIFANETVYTTSNLTVFSEKDKFGLKDKDSNIIVNAEYKKLIRLGTNAWIIQKKDKFGLINCKGEILIKPKYAHVERIFDKWVKLGNTNDYGLYDEFGKAIIQPEFSLIEPLFGAKFLTCKKYKYGVYSDTGEVLIDNKFDMIYMPNPKTMKLKYNNDWIVIEKITKDEALKLPEGAIKVKIKGEDFQIMNAVINTGVGAGYSVVNFTDYMIKIFSVISISYEDTIDELMLSQGAETVNIFKKMIWLPKFPVVYAKKYYFNIKNPNQGPLTYIKGELKEQLK